MILYQTPLHRKRRLDKRLFLIFTIYIALITHNTFSVQVVLTPEYDSAQAHLKRGSIRQARTFIDRALKQQPENCELLLLASKMVSCSTSLSYLIKLTTQPSCSDSLRAEGYNALGEYFFVDQSYEDAYDNFKKALDLRKSPRFKHRMALCYFVQKDTINAQNLWKSITTEYTGSWKLRAFYHLGEIELSRGNYKEALDLFTKAGNPKTSDSWAVPLLEGKLRCAENLNYSEMIPSLVDSLTLLGAKPKILAINKRTDSLPRIKPSTTIDSSPTSIPIRSTPSVKTGTDTSVKKSAPLDEIAVSTDTTPKDEYTLQVGAFSSKENAETLYNKLKGTFKDLSIIPVTVDDQIFYRVWVGSFPSKDSAQTYGSSELTKASIQFRVVKNSN